MNRRLLVCSDIHGQYEQFIRLLEKAEYDARLDQLLLLGDYVDRGPNSREVVEKVIDLVENQQAIALKGNHDQMFIDCILKNVDRANWVMNGGYATLRSYQGHNMQEHAKWMNENLRLYYETDEYIFVHACVKPNIAMQLQKEEHLLWMRHNEPCNLGKLVIHGHSPVNEVTQIHDQLFVDTGSVFGGSLTLYVLPTGDTFKVA